MFIKTVIFKDPDASAQEFVAASRHANLTETLGVLFNALWASIESFRLARAPVEY